MKEIKKLTDILPEGWEAAAKTEKALQRSGIYIKTPEDLFNLVLLYLTEGKTFGQTSALLKITGKMPMNKNAVYERITGSKNWLKWMCEHLCRENDFIPEAPEWLKNHHVCLVDATNESKPGSHKTDYRLHYMIDLFSLCMKEMHLTTGAEGERISRFETLGKDDLVLADRIYGTITGITYLHDREADYIFRLRANAFNLYEGKYNENGEMEYDGFDLTEKLKKWEAGKTLNFHLYCKSGKQYLPVRVCAVGKTKEEVQKSDKQTKKSNSGKNRRKITPLQKIYNRYFVVITSLNDEITTKQVLELYRMRWQIELVFKCFKSIFDFDGIAAQKDETAYTWFYGTLLLAAICEALVNQGRYFFPTEE